jgi:endonuclease/exonuclease/phosphatase family metal-dependent hydrolase
MSSRTKTIVAVALLVLVAGCASASKGHRMQREPSGGAPIRVMSFNVRYGTAPDGANVWANRRDLLMRTIRAFDPDLLGAQEAMEFQCDEMRELLAGHAFVGVGRDDGNSKGEFSPIFYRADRYERIGAGQFWLSEAPDAPGSKGWDSAFPRLATWVRLRDRRDGGRDLIFLNTHWDHAGPEARLQSARLIRQRLAALAGAGAAVIITGDLNCTEDDEPYAVLLGRGDDAITFTDAYRAAHTQRQTDEATFHGFRGTIAGSRIDFVFHTPQFETRAASIDRVREGQVFPSDHYPVTATLHSISKATWQRVPPRP